MRLSDRLMTECGGAADIGDIFTRIADIIQRGRADNFFSIIPIFERGRTEIPQNAAARRCRASRP
jgi:hypothetical protein